METIPQAVLADAVKAITATILQQLKAHNVKGAELLESGIAVTEQIVEHGSQLFTLIKALVPLFGQIYDAVKSWLQSAYAGLVTLFDWAKDLWNAIFGHKQVA